MTIAPLAIYFLYFIFSHPDSELCTPETRTQECIADGFAPVCAIYTGDNCHSGTGFCYKTLSNSCDACVEDNIIGYTFGECQQPTLPQVCKDKQRGLNCEDELDDQSVCAYSKPRRFKGQKALIAHTKSNSCEACSADQTVFHIPGACQQFETFGVCLDLKSEGCYEEQAGPLCVYYTGEDCTEKICRRTELNSCNVCQDSTVLFYTQGACAGYQVPMEYDDGPVQQDYIPELEAVLQEDGTTVYEEVPPKEEGSECSHETQYSIPELKAVVQEDGTIIYEEVEPTDEPEEAIEEYMPVVQADGSIVYEKVKDVIERMSEVGWPPEDCIRCVDPEEVPEPKEESVVEKMAEIGWPPEDCIKCVDSEEPETTVPESVVEKMAEIGWPPEDCIKCVDPEEPETTVPESVIEKMAEIGWPPEDCINCVDPEEQVPESVIEKMAEIGWPPEDCIKCVDPEEPEVEAVTQEDGAVAFDKVQPVEVDYVESQENIPKIEAVIQPDGSVVYEEVQPSDEEEKVKPTPFFVTEVIESRFLGTEPSN